MKRFLLGLLLAGAVMTPTLWANTSRLNLLLPTYQSSRWDIPTNSNWNTVDASVAALSVYNLFTASNTFNSTSNFAGGFLLNGSAGNNGQILASAGVGFIPTWINAPSGATPGGSSGQFQFNSASAFAGSTDITTTGNGTGVNISSANISSNLTVNSKLIIPYIPNNELLFNLTGTTTGDLNITVPTIFGSKALQVGIGSSISDKLMIYPNGGSAGSGISIYANSNFDPMFSMYTSNPGSSNNAGIAMPGQSGDLASGTTVSNLVIFNKNSGFNGDIDFAAGNRSVRDLIISGIDGSLKSSSGTISNFTVADSDIHYNGKNWIYSVGSNNFFAGGSGGTGVGNVSAGSSNIAIGTNSGISLNASGSNNSLLGLNSGQSLTSGSRNTAIGQNSLSVNQSGSDNTTIGNNAGTNETGSSNTYVGSNAGQQTKTLTGSTAIGFGANNISSFTAVIGDVSNFLIQGSTPSINSCGTGSPSVIGTDTSGLITVGGGGLTLCSITFSQMYTFNPFCISQTTFTAISSVISAISTTGLTITSSAGLASGASLTYLCVGRQ